VEGFPDILHNTHEIIMSAVHIQVGVQAVNHHLFCESGSKANGAVDGTDKGAGNSDEGLLGFGNALSHREEVFERNRVLGAFVTERLLG
jgi:hypothetical protein